MSYKQEEKIEQYNGMNAFAGTKLVNAKPMNRAEYNTFRGWELPANENGADEGYLVEYAGELQKPNTKEYEGYVSWSPKDVFEDAYKPITSMDFGMALLMLKDGEKVARSGWNGKGMWIMLCIPEGEYTLASTGETYERLPYIYMKTADNKLVPWLASQTDVLAEDWTIVQ